MLFEDNMVFVIERHDDRYNGPHSYRIAETFETALEIAEEMRESHRSDEWDFSVRDRDGDQITMHGNASGWVSIKKKPLHE